MVKYDIFISYSLQDCDEVKEFVSLLKTYIPTLVCCTDITSEEFDETQANTLNDSECLLFMQSDGSLLSSRIKDEVVYAKSIGKKVVPVLLKGAKKSGWYMFKYGSLGFVDSNDSAEIDKLINSISEWTGKNIENIVTDDVLVSTEMVADAAGEVKSSTDKDNVVEEKNNTHFNELFVYEVFTPEPTVEEPPIDECINDESFGKYTIEEGSTAPFEELPDESYDEQNGGQYSDTSVFDEFSNDSSLSSYETIGERDATEADIGEYINEPQPTKATEITPDDSAKQSEQHSEMQVPLGFRLILVIIVIVFSLFRLCSSGEDYTDKRARSEDFAAVSKDGKWGFVDSRNKNVVPIKYDIVEDYHNGFAIVGLNGKWGYVNKVGKEIVPIKYEKVFPFKNDRGCVKFKGKYGFVDTFGRVIVFPKYENPISFTLDYAPVTIDGKWGIVDKNGKEFVSLSYDDVGGFFDGVARVQKNGKFGFVGIDGAVIAHPIYDKVREFTEGFAAVQKNGKWGFLDNKGNSIVYPKYAEVQDFRSSRAAVMSDGKWGFIDNSGKEVVPLKYDSVGSFITNAYGTFADVTLNGKDFFIDENGNPIKFS